MNCAAGHRPLLVKPHVEGHYSVHDIAIEGEQRLTVHAMSHPVVEPLHYRPLAVSAGCTILGVTPPAASHMVMLAVGDDTVIRMDTVVYGESSRFEMLRRHFPGGGWSTIPLPRPPLRLPSQSSVSSISAYFVMGTRVWISVTGEGTFSLDTQLGVWRMEFPEELRRLQGRAFFVPELGSVVGLTGEDDRFLCSYKLNDDGKERGVPLTWQHTWSEAVPYPWECCEAPWREMVSLAYLGEGRFCVYRPVKVLGTAHNFNSFLVLELRRRPPDGKELEIAKRGVFYYHGMWPDQGLYQDIYFIQ
ncbi:hypothetical protein C2845_PM03G15830 [Panicum miliaceum]|uniref:DUF1618 domain-containing protein n=1 Tax=Panicum miliaceum TaxID=4540 RepID=A0A3L6T6B7_PANMI|nr:hypothetical protein C2845_PM03G15830 [Panicum miliaceum]